MSRSFLDFFQILTHCGEVTYGSFSAVEEAFLATKTVTHSRSWESPLKFKALLNIFHCRQFQLNFWHPLLSIITEYAQGAAGLNA
jgi:hypothetical protein